VIAEALIMTVERDRGGAGLPAGQEVFNRLVITRPIVVEIPLASRRRSMS
jgi:hypothetical protein